MGITETARDPTSSTYVSSHVQVVALCFGISLCMEVTKSLLR
jgi:hypothetical protein